MNDPATFTNWPSAFWLRATADDELRADPTPALCYVARDVHAGCAVLTPVVEGYEPIACRVCQDE
jgi:hypothetical protein